MTPHPPTIRTDLHLKIVQEIGELVNRSQGLETILGGVVDTVAEALGLDVVSIYLWDRDESELVLRASHGLKLPSDRQVRLSPREGMTGLVYTTRRPQQAVPASQHPRYKYIPDIGEEQYDSYLGVPILLHSQCLGVLVGQYRAQKPFNPAEQTLFQIIASRLAGVLEVADRLDRLRRPTPEQHAYQGKGISSGFACGPVHVLRGLYQSFSGESIPSTGRKNEQVRLSGALSATEKDLETLVEELTASGTLQSGEINIFRTHLAIVRDDAFRKRLNRRITERDESATTAVIQEIEAVANQFARQADPYLRERATDFRDLGEKILTHLHPGHGRDRDRGLPPQSSVLVAHDIGPSLLAQLHRSKIAAIVTEVGGETSHVAILARSLGIPAVSGVKNLMSLVTPGERLLVDGKTGFVFRNPDEGLVAEYQATTAATGRVREALAKAEPAEGISVTANIGFPSDLEAARRYGIRDVGLFRTEFSFMQFDGWPSIEQQREIYGNVASHFEGYVTVRTLDIGADKLLPYFDFPAEDNPLLGLRSIRFSMEYLDLFREQVHAILSKVADGCNLRILLPMVSQVYEVETARDVVRQIGQDIGLGEADLPPMGAMIEVPAIVHQIEDYVDLIDFVSVGTNDLTQYLLAVDRNSHTVGHLFSGLHPAVLRTLRHIQEAMVFCGKECSICGELAGTPTGALALLSMGFTNFSVQPASASVVRFLAGRLTDEIRNDIRQQILSERKEADIRALLLEALSGIHSDLCELE